MRKIYSFSDFSSLYEADAVTPTEASKLYDQTLGSNSNNCFERIHV
jgi:hypothetical protein